MHTQKTPNHKSDAQATSEVHVVKRDGTLQEFNLAKISNAITAAYTSLGLETNGDFESVITKIKKQVFDSVTNNQISVEQIQDIVEVCLMKSKRTDVAKAYIIYREKRATERAKGVKRIFDMSALADYIHPAKYANYIPDKQRRELYSETVDRRKKMDLDAFPTLKDAIDWSYQFVYNKEVLPSMRSFQFGGKAIEVNNLRCFNCSFTFIDRIEVFAEIFHLLLCGCGVGYSVQFHHIEQLPEVKLIDETKVRHHIVKDSIEGWSDAIGALFDSYLRTGEYVEFAYHKIRDRNQPLKTSGGKAPGHVPLRRCIEILRGILNAAAGRQLRSIEIHDCICHIADAVLSGGIRRSSLICLFSIDDGDMMRAKVGEWWKENPQRALANNSVLLVREQCTKAQYKRIFKFCKQYGEPGVVFAPHTEIGFNPCVEACLDPVLTITAEVKQLIKQWEEETGKKAPKNLKLGDKFTGFGFCNLCEINAATIRSAQDFLDRCKAASIIGTMQAARTNFPYLSWVSEIICRREALLGVGLTGMMANPKYALDPELQQRGAEMVVETNIEFAHKLGIRSAARTTVVKPAGTSTLELGLSESGIHAAHSKKFFRRVTANELEPVFQYFKSINPHMCEPKDNGDWSIIFPVEVKEGTITKNELNGVKFLETVRSTYLNWVKPGTARPESSPGATHNVSNTCTVKANEWEEVSEYLWTHRNDFAAVSFLPDDGDKKYAHAPFESVSNEADEAKWNYLVDNFKPVDYSKLIETDDATSLIGEVACAGGACSIV